MSRVQLVSDDESFEVKIGDSFFTLSRIPADETTKMLRRHTKKVPGSPEKETDHLTFNREYRDRTIRSWREIDGDPPCTIDNKMRLPNETWAEIQQITGASNIEELKAKERALGN